MSAKRKEGILDLKSSECAPPKTYVKFRNGHLQLDVRGFLGSREGKEAVAKVIGLSKRIPKRASEEVSGQSAEVR